MSNASINLSVESPMEDVTTWENGTALPIPPRLSESALHSVALAPPISPCSALTLLDVHDDIDPDALQSIARGLTITMQQRDAYYAQQRHRNEQRIKDLEKRIGGYEEIFDSALDGYEENNGQLPNFSIPVGKGMYHVAKYIKQLDRGWVAGFTEEDRPHSTPHIIELYAAPFYTTLDTTDEPAEPMPAWFHRILFGHAALYSTMQKAILDIDD
jgi:hypothetical protein